MHWSSFRCQVSLATVLFVVLFVRENDHYAPENLDEIYEQIDWVPERKQKKKLFFLSWCWLITKHDTMEMTGFQYFETQTSNFLMVKKLSHLVPHVDIVHDPIRLLVFTDQQGSLTLTLRGNTDHAPPPPRPYHAQTKPNWGGRGVTWLGYPPLPR